MASSDRRVIGVAHSDPSTAYFSIPSTDWFAFSIGEDDISGTRHPPQIIEEIQLRREIHERRRFAAVVSGSESFLRSYLDELQDVDALVLCADEPTLKKLGVAIIDSGWTKDSPPLGTLDRFLGGTAPWPRPTKSRRKWFGKVAATVVTAAAETAIERADVRRKEPHARTEIRRPGGSGIVGYVAPDGRVFKGDDAWTTEVGAVDDEGGVWSGQEPMRRRVGSVERSGVVVEGEFPREERVGNVMPDGEVRQGDELRFDVVGEVRGPALHAAGAALLLLLRGEA